MFEFRNDSFKALLFEDLLSLNELHKQERSVFLPRSIGIDCSANFSLFLTMKSNKSAPIPTRIVIIRFDGLNEETSCLHSAIRILGIRLSSEGIGSFIICVEYCFLK